MSTESTGGRYLDAAEFGARHGLSRWTIGRLARGGRIKGAQQPSGNRGQWRIPEGAQIAPTPNTTTESEATVAISCSNSDCQDIQFNDHTGAEAQEIAATHNQVWHGGGNYATGS